MSYGTPRAVIADNDVICLRCAFKEYFRMEDEDLTDFVKKIERKEVPDRQKEPLELVLEGCHDFYLHTRYCPLCTSRLCPPECECHAVYESICPFCNEGFDPETDINAGHYDHFRGFYAHVDCLELGVETKDGDVFHKGCLKEKQPVTTLTLDSDGVERLICCACNDFLVNEDTKEEFFDDSDGCECDTCELVAAYALEHSHPVQVEGYRLGVLGARERHEGFTTVDYARFMGFGNSREEALFVAGYTEAENGDDA